MKDGKSIKQNASIIGKFFMQSTISPEILQLRILVNLLVHLHVQYTHDCFNELFDECIDKNHNKSHMSCMGCYDEQKIQL